MVVAGTPAKTFELDFRANNDICLGDDVQHLNTQVDLYANVRTGNGTHNYTVRQPCPEWMIKSECNSIRYDKRLLDSPTSKFYTIQSRILKSIQILMWINRHQRNVIRDLVRCLLVSPIEQQGTEFASQ